MRGVCLSEHAIYWSFVCLFVWSFVETECAATRIGRTAKMRGHMRTSNNSRDKGVEGQDEVVVLGRVGHDIGGKEGLVLDSRTISEL